MTTAKEKTMIKPNRIAGTGRHSHEIPTTEGLVVDMCDSRHRGTAIWLQYDGTYAFACRETRKVEFADRCVLLCGQDAELIPDVPFGVDVDSPRGLLLIGLSNGQEIGYWLSDGAEILWDSAADLQA